MLNSFKIVGTVLLLVGFTGCAVDTSDIKVKNVKSEKVNLDGYKTYLIMKDSGIINNTKKGSSSKMLDINVEIRKIINSELENKGKISVTNNPDFLVIYAAGSEIESVNHKVNKNGNKIFDATPESVMALVLLDAKTGAVIDKSMAEGQAKGLPHDEMIKRIKFAIKTMLNNL